MICCVTLHQKKKIEKCKGDSKQNLQRSVYQKGRLLPQPPPSSASPFYRHHRHCRGHYLHHHITMITITSTVSIVIFTIITIIINTILVTPCRACGILVPWPGIEPKPLAVKAQSLNHRTTREFPHRHMFWSRGLSQLKFSHLVLVLPRIGNTMLVCKTRTFLLDTVKLSCCNKEAPDTMT